MSVKKERLGYSVEQSGPDKHEKLLWFCRGFYSVIQKIPLISRALKPDVNNNQDSDKTKTKRKKASSWCQIFSSKKVKRSEVELNDFLAFLTTALQTLM